MLIFFQYNFSQNHFVPVWTNNPYLPMNIYISQALIGSLPLMAGDEIAVFDGDICVGSTQLQDSIVQGNPVSIIASTDDPLTSQQDGFIPGNIIKFKVWDSGSQKEIFNCLPAYIYGNGIFNPLGSVFAEINCFSTLKIAPIKLLIEGLFNGNVMIPDTVKIELRFYAQPYNLLDSAVVLVDSLGSAAAEFNNIKLNENFYIVIKHRNSIETWSRLPQVFNTGLISYDFTIDSSQAYGNNMVYKNGKWCIYSGDVNQDGAIDSTDLMLVFYENVSGSTGYIQSDLNGDMFCEIEDLMIVYLN